MPRRNIVFEKGGHYHVYNRGAGRGPLFFSPANYEYCLRLVKRYRRQYGAAILAYCLMPNHYHFLLRQEGDDPAGLLPHRVFNSY